ncbi:hypothetical protein T08_3625 [Trichinella sp. T8]|nr:hypothetical protein T08_3625 [Trichinella sp. T8]
MLIVEEAPEAYFGHSFCSAFTTIKAEYSNEATLDDKKFNHSLIYVTALTTVALLQFQAYFQV